MRRLSPGGMISTHLSPIKLSLRIPVRAAAVPLLKTAHTSPEAPVIIELSMIRLVNRNFLRVKKGRKL